MLLWIATCHYGVGELTTFAALLCSAGLQKAADGTRLLISSINRYSTSVSHVPVTILGNCETEETDLSSQRSEPN